MGSYGIAPGLEMWDINGMLSPKVDLQQYCDWVQCLASFFRHGSSIFYREGKKAQSYHDELKREIKLKAWRDCPRFLLPSAYVPSLNVPARETQQCVRSSQPARYAY